MGIYGDNGKENGNYYNGLYYTLILGVYRGNIGIMEKKIETTIVYWGYMEKHHDLGVSQNQRYNFSGPHMRILVFGKLPCRA